jgi:SAM-dependent methyltransferase
MLVGLYGVFLMSESFDNFDAYATYYDALYLDKDYEAEVSFILQKLNSFAPNAKSILELGCGTGRHAADFARSGYSVRGVDLSESMIEFAQNRKAICPDDIRSKLSFSTGDARSFDAGREYDVVLALFHVASYQSSNDDIQSFIKNAAKHLKKGGVFIFDYWYGPGVLTDPPAVRVKRLEIIGGEITRIAEPELLVEECCVNVCYDIRILETASMKEKRLYEEHKMRYFFKPELEMLCESAGLQVLQSASWMDAKPLNSGTWNAYSVAVK